MFFLKPRASLADSRQKKFYVMHARITYILLSTRLNNTNTAVLRKTMVVIIIYYYAITS